MHMSGLYFMLVHHFACQSYHIIHVAHISYHKVFMLSDITINVIHNLLCHHVHGHNRNHTHNLYFSCCGRRIPSYLKNKNQLHLFFPSTWATPCVWARGVVLLFVVLATKSLLMGIKTTNELLNRHVLEVTKCLMEVIICMNLRGRLERTSWRWRSPPSCRITNDTGDVRRQLHGKVVHRLTILHGIVSNSLFKECTLASLTNSILMHCLQRIFMLPLSSPFPTWEGRSTTLLGRWQ